MLALWITALACLSLAAIVDAAELLDAESRDLRVSALLRLSLLGVGIVGLVLGR